ncbi:MAG TPA: carboxypeptidase regulatory-like domain-containing protein [Candidatus Diapherotrites archaeon]|uniref:Carboxypeptidase regulatory-like domain-containing protein n=1 Tax=Candidatus Iainarchaeum sp. TaxID=3101447 RepID=A0A7J4KSU3_9ARCH|nr:carboxypeptidase regulatory-like domain-containing protein [Candidatus Diapherotrites archaeon]
MRIGFVLLAGVFALLVLSGCVSVASLEIQVVDSEGNTVSNALVKVVKESGVAVSSVSTDSGGNVSLSLSVGTYNIIVEKQGFEPASKSVELKQGANKVSVTLSAAETPVPSPGLPPNQDIRTLPFMIPGLVEKPSEKPFSPTGLAVLTDSAQISCGEWKYYSAEEFTGANSGCTSSMHPILSAVDDTTFGFWEKPASFEQGFYKTSFLVESSEADSLNDLRPRISLKDSKLYYIGQLTQTQAGSIISIYHEVPLDQNGLLSFDLINFNGTTAKLNVNHELSVILTKSIPESFEFEPGISLNDWNTLSAAAFFKVPAFEQSTNECPGLCITTQSVDGNEFGAFSSLFFDLEASKVYKFSFAINAGDNAPLLRLRLNSSDFKKSSMLVFYPQQGLATYNLYYETSSEPAENSVSLSLDMANFDTGKQGQRIELSAVSAFKQDVIIEQPSGNGFLEIEVVDGNAMPLPAASLARVQVLQGDFVEVQEVNSEGLVFFELPNGVYNVRVMAEGYFPKDFDINIDVNFTESELVVLTKKQISGDPELVPLPGLGLAVVSDSLSSVERDSKVNFTLYGKNFDEDTQVLIDNVLVTDRFPNAKVEVQDSYTIFVTLIADDAFYAVFQGAGLIPGNDGLYQILTDDSERSNISFFSSYADFNYSGTHDFAVRKPSITLGGSRNAENKGSAFFDSKLQLAGGAILSAEQCAKIKQNPAPKGPQKPDCEGRLYYEWEESYNLMEFDVNKGGNIERQCIDLGKVRIDTRMSCVYTRTIDNSTGTPREGSKTPHAFMISQTRLDTSIEVGSVSWWTATIYTTPLGFFAQLPIIFVVRVRSDDPNSHWYQLYYKTKRNEGLVSESKAKVSTSGDGFVHYTSFRSFTKEGAEITATVSSVGPTGEIPTDVSLRVITKKTEYDTLSKTNQTIKDYPGVSFDGGLTRDTVSVVTSSTYETRNKIKEWQLVNGEEAEASLVEQDDAYKGVYSASYSQCIRTDESCRPVNRSSLSIFPALEKNSGAVSFADLMCNNVRMTKETFAEYAKYKYLPGWKETSSCNKSYSYVLNAEPDAAAKCAYIVSASSSSPQDCAIPSSARRAD